MYKVSYSNKLYAGKFIYKKLLPGHPRPLVDDINKFMGEIEDASVMLLTNQHTNIEQFHSIVQLTSDSPPILLTELLHENLNNYASRMKGKLSVHVQLDLCHDMAKGLQFLHTAGLVHNNLHGANVLISQVGRAKIADYICSRVDSLNENVTPQHTVYTSPDLVKNIHAYSKQLDIYSLGVLYLQVATQSPPMPKESVELSAVQCFKEQLDEITTNPLFPLIVKCLDIKIARPSIDRVCAKIATAKENPQSLMYNTLYHIKVRVYLTSYLDSPFLRGLSTVDIWLLSENYITKFLVTDFRNRFHSNCENITISALQFSALKLTVVCELQK